MKQKLFTQAIVWIAENDEPTVKEAAGMVNLISVALDAVRVRFGADYVFCTKKFSTATFKAATEKVCTLYGVPQPPIEEGTEPYIKGGGPRVPQADGIDLATLVYRELRSEDRKFQEAQWAKEDA